MADIAFFVLYYDVAAAGQVDSVCDQLIEACKGDRLIVTAPDGIIIEQFAVGRPEDGEEWKG